MQRYYILFLSIILLLAGCSLSPAPVDEQETSSGQVQPKEEKTATEKDEKAAWWEEEDSFYNIKEPRELTELEKSMLPKEGSFSGDRYDLKKIKEQFRDFPKDATENEITEAILKVIREDYHEELETLLNFDPTVNVNLARPDERIEEPAMVKSHFAILLDASGSMNASNGGNTRMAHATAAIENFIELLPKDSSVSLRVYGHVGTGSTADKELSCSSTERLYTGTADKEKMKEALDNVSPSGWTPIAKALSETRNDIPEDADSMIVYVVSDGIETCDGDPVAEAKKLAGEGIQPIINIIGFQVDNEAQKLLKEVAKAGNGEFSYVSSGQELEHFWKEEYDRLQAAWTEWKNEALKLAEDKKQELLKLAEDTGRRIMDKSLLEFNRGTAVLEFLKAELDLEYEVYIAVWNSLYDRKTAIWNYGYDSKVKNWSDSYHNGVEAWNKAYEEGNSKWLEYYEKKYKN